MSLRTRETHGGEVRPSSHKLSTGYDCVTLVRVSRSESWVKLTLGGESCVMVLRTISSVCRRIVKRSRARDIIE